PAFAKASVGEAQNLPSLKLRWARPKTLIFEYETRNYKPKRRISARGGTLQKVLQRPQINFNISE
ncbi:MAG: hypothetical protein NXH73_11960, partial [Flavobacteriaceae bacterium]|nr:hypothetical protein [Flavobacteriaceae bacterium]